MKRNKNENNQGASGKNVRCSIDDPIHPVQFWGNTERQRYDPLLPDKKLWAAVLIDAIKCLSGHVVGEGSRDKQAKEIRMAKEWFLSERKDVGSFLWVCRMLDLVSEQVLKEVVELCRHNNWQHNGSFLKLLSRDNLPDHRKIPIRPPAS